MTHNDRNRAAKNRGHHEGTWRPASTCRSDAPSRAASGTSEDAASLLRGERLALTISEAASLLGIPRALAYDLAARGELPSVRLGRRLVVPKVALMEMIGRRPGSEA